MTPEEAFFRLHEGLDRQGPGTPEDVAWALAVAGVAPGARILDAGCGAGADIPALLKVPEARLTAVDTHAPFIETVRRRFPGVEARAESMADTPGPFDFVWCAGALYFLGIAEGLRILAAKLAPGGAIAFSEPVWLGDARPARAAAFWAEYPALTDLAGLDARIAGAGMDVRGRRLLAPGAWAAYYAPMEARIAALRPGAPPALAAVLDAAEEEIAVSRADGDAYTYALTVVTR